MPDCKCPFYGLSVPEGVPNFATIGLGNRCGLVIDAHAPCYMEAYQGKPPVWKECPSNTPATRVITDPIVRNTIVMTIHGGDVESMEARYERLTGEEYE